MELLPEVDDLIADDYFTNWCDDLDAWAEARHIESGESIYPLMAAVGIAYAIVELGVASCSYETWKHNQGLLATYAHLITTLVRNLTDVGFFRPTADGLVIALPELVG